MTEEVMGSIHTNEDHLLLCPQCDEQNTHVELVQVAAREEDRPFTNISVNAVTAEVHVYPTGEGSVPAGEAVGQGRRQRISIRLSCEQCGRSSDLVLTQHKGVTFAEWMEVPAEDFVPAPGF
jgi:hypothetical protein